MFRKNNFYQFFFGIFLVCSPVFFHAQCLQIESILADACVPGGGCVNVTSPTCGCEGKNEMVRFKVRSVSLNVSNLIPTWPNNTFKGWSQNATTAANVAALNSTIVACGYLREPVGGVLPANSEVLIITSEDMCVNANSFANLYDTLTVIFQTAGNFQGHFANQNNGLLVSPIPVGPLTNRTLTLSYAPLVCSQSVTYHPNALVNNLGTYGGAASINDGATIMFDSSGNDSYVNAGCQVPFLPLTVDAMSNITMCYNGTTTLTATGGGNFTQVLWSLPNASNGTFSSPNSLTTNFSPSASAVSPQKVYVTLSIGCGLFVKDSMLITLISSPSQTITSSNGTSFCSGDSVQLSVLQESGVTYVWNPGAITGTNIYFSPTANTIYTVTATNACASTNSTFGLTVLPLPIISATAFPPVICNGFSTTLNAVGANTYDWVPGQLVGSTVTISPISSQTYTVVGTSTLTGCTNLAQVIVNVNSAPIVTASATLSTICQGQSTTLIGAGANTYTWFPGGFNGTSISVNPTSPQTFTVTGTDVNGCANFSQVSVNVNSLPMVSAVAISPIICEGQSTTLNAFGASTYLWAPGSLASSSITVFPPINQTYTVTGINANGCVNTFTLSVDVNPIPTINAVANQTVCAGLAVSQINFTGSAGASFSWVNSNNSIGLSSGPLTGDISQFISANVLVSETGIITATPSFSTGCLGTPTTFSITVNTNPLIDTLSLINSAANCGASDGSLIGITATGNSPFTFSWDNGLTFSASSNLFPVIAGTYNLIVQDANSCTTNSSFTIINSIGPPAPALVSSPISECEGAPVSLSIFAPVVGYTYTWTAAPGGLLGTGTSMVINNIGPVGSYVVTITATDAGNCLGPATSYTIAVNSNPVPTISATTLDFCYGDSLQINASPVNTGNIYQWFNGSNSIALANDAFYFTNTSGIYGVQITDSNLCTGFSFFPLTISVNPNPIISTAGAIIIPSSCISASGVASAITVSSGTSGFTFNWYSSTFPPGTLVSTSLTTDSLINVGAGIYTLVVIDSKGCTDTASLSMINSATPLAPLVVTPASYCSGEVISALCLTGTGGIYTWYTDAGLTNVIGNGSCLNPIPNPTTTTIYYVTETNNGCESNGTAVTITINPIPSIPLTANAAYCEGQIINPFVSSSVGGVVYWYSDSAGTMLVGTGNNFTPITAPLVTTIYYLVDSSSNGCKSVVVTDTLFINALPPSPVVAGNATYCSGQLISALTALATGTINWYSDVAATNLVSIGSSYTPSPAPIITTVYYLTATSPENCKSLISSDTIFINQTPVAPTVANATINYCSGATINPLTASASAATILWYTNASLTPPAIAVGNSYVPVPSPGVGTTTYYIIDSSSLGCKSSVTTLTLLIHPNPVVSGGLIDSTYCGNNNGGITGVIVSNGTPLYTYQWTNSVSSAVVGTQLNLVGVGAGMYNFLVTDVNGCTAYATTTYTVSSIAGVAASFSATPTIGTAPLLVTMSNTSNGAISYTWNFGDGSALTNQTDATNTYTNYGTYTITLVATNGLCVDTATQVIFVDMNAIIIIPNIFSPNGDGTNDQFFITASGIASIEWTIFNRWGQLVFSSNTLSNVWDGTFSNGNKCAEGTYYYLVKALGFNGTEYTKQGSCMLVK